MKLGNKIYFFFLLLNFFWHTLSAEDRISTTPLINVEEIKPSFEEPDDENENITLKQDLKEKKKSLR